MSSSYFILENFQDNLKRIEFFLVNLQTKVVLLNFGTSKLVLLCDIVSLICAHLLVPIIIQVYGSNMQILNTNDFYRQHWLNFDLKMYWFVLLKPMFCLVINSDYDDNCLLRENWKVASVY